ncbi:MAG: hypothetical protein Q9218_003292 [Villophora microphyllina]
MTAPAANGLGTLNKLPPEVRLMIWEYFMPPTSPTDAELEQRKYQCCNVSSQPSIIQPYALSVLRTSKDVYQEVSHEIRRKIDRNRTLTICLGGHDVTPSAFMDEKPTEFHVMLGGVCSLRRLDKINLSYFDSLRIHIVAPGEENSKLYQDLKPRISALVRLVHSWQVPKTELSGLSPPSRPSIGQLPTAEPYLPVRISLNVCAILAIPRFPYFYGFTTARMLKPLASILDDDDPALNIIYDHKWDQESIQSFSQLIEKLLAETRHLKDDKDAMN